MKITLIGLGCTGCVHQYQAWEYTATSWVSYKVNCGTECPDLEKVVTTIETFDVLVLDSQIRKDCRRSYSISNNQQNLNSSRTCDPVTYYILIADSYLNTLKEIGWKQATAP